MAPGLPSAFGSLRLGVGGVEGCGSSHSVVGGEHVLWEPTLAPGPVSASRGLCPSSVSTPKPAARLPEQFYVGKITRGHVTAFALVLKNGLNTCLLANTIMGT